MATTTKTQNNIDIYNKNKIAELKAIHKFLNSVFGTATASNTSSKKSDKAMAAALEAAVADMVEAQ
ncbi:hypothetical protein LJC48_06775 [Desulfovibrio sp. OttesenSCG-928-C06]|nr:hypothetical protein [Desulfovibrio sp. OttesenSCG-928-C06]